MLSTLEPPYSAQYSESVGANVRPAAKPPLTLANGGGIKDAAIVGKRLLLTLGAGTLEYKASPANYDRRVKFKVDGATREIPSGSLVRVERETPSGSEALFIERSTGCVFSAGMTSGTQVSLREIARTPRENNSSARSSDGYTVYSREIKTVGILLTKHSIIEGGTSAILGDTLVIMRGGNRLEFALDRQRSVEADPVRGTPKLLAFTSKLFGTVYVCPKSKQIYAAQRVWRHDGTQGIALIRAAALPASKEHNDARAAIMRGEPIPQRPISAPSPSKPTHQPQPKSSVAPAPKAEVRRVAEEAAVAPQPEQPSRWARFRKAAAVAVLAAASVVGAAREKISEMFAADESREPAKKLMASLPEAPPAPKIAVRAPSIDNAAKPVSPPSSSKTSLAVRESEYKRPIETGLMPKVTDPVIEPLVKTSQISKAAAAEPFPEFKPSLTLPTESPKPIPVERELVTPNPAPIETEVKRPVQGLPSLLRPSRLLSQEKSSTATRLVEALDRTKGEQLSSSGGVMLEPDLLTPEHLLEGGRARSQAVATALRSNSSASISTASAPAADGNAIVRPENLLKGETKSGVKSALLSALRGNKLDTASAR
ncbi:MAG: hypothetical protein J5J00_16405 [Deltaproteobacteria bacterium]|nr:hypothetical protein [Deltaproteobacteria bacterium]